MFKFILITGITFSIMSTVSAQKNYTMQDAVLGLGTNLAIDDIPQLDFVGKSNKLVNLKKISDGKEVLLSSMGGVDKYDTLINLTDFNKLADTNTRTKKIPKLTWLGDNEFYYQIKNSVLLGKRSNSQWNLSPWVQLPEKSANVNVDTAKKQLAYTIDNNLFLADEYGVKSTIAKDQNKDIIYGQAVHRNEFGINGGIFFSPKGNYLAFYRMDQSMVADYPIINWEPVPAKNENIKYPMAGARSHEVSLGIYNLSTKNTIYLNTGLPADLYLTCITWDPSEKYVYVALLNRDQNHLWLNKYNAIDGTFIATLFEETDAKYVEPQHPLYFLPDGSFVWWSQRSGYMHLYRYNTSGKLLNTITSGDWLVNEVAGIKATSNELIITSSKEDPREKHIYSVNYLNGKMHRLDNSPGTHNALVSADGSRIIDIYRNSTTPKKIDLIKTNTGEYVNLLTAKNPLTNYNNSKVESLSYTADDGTTLFAKIMLPYNFDPNKKYPAVVYLYNGPHVQLITNSFPETGNLWYDYMTQHGFIVFVMDGRGSSNRGLNFEQATFRQLGTVEMKDQLKGVNYLKSLPYVDKDRLGVHGWSFGGFMATSLMTRYPDVFKVAVAGGPVIDWSMYETMYTERYMDDPATNPQGFSDANLLSKAKDLKGKLLMIHGAQDDVVIWQHSIKFIKACVDANVQLDYFVYPGHPHNVRGKDRVHLMQKISDYFIDHL